jgi:RND family efflux transporter MFP subunit
MLVLRALTRMILGLAAIGACWVAWWIVYQDSRARVADKGEAKAEEVLTVQVMPVGVATVQERIELVGSLQARNQVEVRSRTSGYVTALPYDVGDVVQAGHDVVYLDDTEQQERVANSEAALTVAQAELQASEAEHGLAQQNLQRQKNLRQSGAGTEKLLEEAQAAVSIAAARIALGQARVREFTSLMRQAKLALQDLKITTPIKGVVGRRLVDVGNLAQPELPLLMIVDLDTVQTIVHVIEKDYQQVSVGQQAEVRVDACPDEVFRGQVARIAPVVDPETRTAAVHIDIPNPRHLLKPGMHGRVGIVFQSRRGSSVVPVDAVVASGETQAVFVVSGDPPQAERRPVRVGVTDGEVVEVLEGLSRSERVVTLGNRLIQHGQRVNPEEVAWPQSLASADDDEPLTPSE